MMDENEVAKLWWEPIESIVKGPFVRKSDTMIDCILVHPDLGEIPFTATSDDPEPHGRAAHAYATDQMEKGA